MAAATSADALVDKLPLSLSRLATRIATPSTELPPLQPRKPFDVALTSDIDSFAAAQKQDKPYVRAALHILNDDIPRAHDIAQADDGDATSNLCHAILHRREGDFWNSKWWYKQISHPLIKQAYGSTAEAQAFVDAVQGATKSVSSPCAAGNLDKLKRKQADELALLVQYVLEH